MKKYNVLMTVIIVLAIGSVAMERIYVSKMEERFHKLEDDIIETSNKLTTAKIVSENMHHVRDLIVKNMEFKGSKYTQKREDDYYDFLTGCINDLKLKLVSFRPLLPVKKGRITEFPYEFEVEGNFFKIGELCAKFENSHRIVSIENFEIELMQKQIAGKKNATKPVVKTLMRVKTYWISSGT